jgi:hypothetical protein
MENSMKINFFDASRNPLTTAFAILIVLLAAVPRFCFAEQRFPSAEDAANALFVAMRDGDEKALARILGAGKKLISARDDGQDTRAQFVAKYQQMHRLVREPDQTTVLYVGREDGRFPIPLVSRRSAWCFDAATALREVLYRRIGANEVNALAVCHTLVEAKRQIPGAANADGKPVRYHGYYFRIFSRPNDTNGGDNDNRNGGDEGFVVIAYPVKYRETGVMTFLVTHHDVVYQRDLGFNTEVLATTVSTYDPNTPWKRAQ